ncbi:MAG: hypothetical protein IK016_01645 [Lachnospiraceae bacterium]|nr:hypothetical protein [Lachnospiraceae bacterium]
MKRKVFAMTALMMAMVLALGACGGKKNSLLDDEDLKELKNEITQIEKEEAGQNTQPAGSTPSASGEEKKEEAVQYEADPRMLEADWSDCIIQIDDMVLDFEEISTGDLLEQIAGKGRYTIDKEATMLVGANSNENVYVSKDGKSVCTIRVANPVESAASLADTIVLTVEAEGGYAETGNVWYPGGICADGAGMSYDACKEYLDQVDVFGNITEDTRSDSIVFSTDVACTSRYHGHLARRFKYKYTVDKNSGLCVFVERDWGMIFTKDWFVAEDLDACFRDAPVNEEDFFMAMPDKWSLSNADLVIHSGGILLHCNLYQIPESSHLEYALGGGYHTLDANIEVDSGSDRDFDLVICNAETGEVLNTERYDHKDRETHSVSVNVSGVQRIGFYIDGWDENGDGHYMAVRLMNGVLH